METQSLKRRRWSDSLWFKVAMGLVIVLSAASLGGFATLLYYSFPESKIIEYYNEPFPTDKSEYHRGEPVIYTVEFHKYASVSSQVSRQLICDIGQDKLYVSTTAISLSNTPKTPKENKSQTFVVDTFKVPDNAPFDVPCYINIVAQYDYNFLKQPIINARTGMFTVRRK